MTAPLVDAKRETIGLVTFTLDGHVFAVRATAVREVVRAVAIAALPDAPPIVEGVVNYRGTIVPVLDVRARFRLAARALDPDQHFIIARTGERTVALRVDRAGDLLGVDVESIAPRETVRGTPYIEGIARLPDGLLVIHDLDAFLSAAEAEDLDRALLEASTTAGP